MEARRVHGLWAEASVATGLVATVAGFALALAGWPVSLPWLVASLCSVVIAGIARLRYRGDRVISWIVIATGLGAVGTGMDVFTDQALQLGAEASAAWLLLARRSLTVGVLLLMLVALRIYPDGRPLPYTVPVLWATGSLMYATVALVTFGAENLPLEWFVQVSGEPNPLHVLPFAIGDRTVQVILGAVWLPALLAPAFLIVRYVTSGPRIRRRLRWLLPPFALIGVVLVVNLVLRENAGAVTVAVYAVFVFYPPLLTAAAILGVVDPRRFDPDRILRRGLVAAVLWIAIAAVFVGAASLIGVTASEYLTVPWAVLLAVVIATLFAPAQRALGRVADRWLFGARPDPAVAIARLGRTLAETFDLGTLLPRMSTALEDGLGITWVRVSITDADEPGPTPDEAPVFAAPVVLDGAHVGDVLCGPKRAGAWSPEDRAVVMTFAQQAALAVANVRLTQRLAAQAAELSASRTRLVHAQEGERRRIERNIHDGVQQDLVALIALVGQFDTEPAVQPTAMDLLRDGLTRVLDDIRDLATGIHPSVLTDQGLLGAVEALSARHPIPVTVRADADLRTARFDEAIEGAGYFIVAEALANSLKHAEAHRVEITLSRNGARLEIAIADDGIGPGGDPLGIGRGLAGVRDRIEALGGSLTVARYGGGGTLVRASLDAREVEFEDA
ncbi:sensor histidine kinase [Agromyces sp. SYSU T00266]|uniref:sensor histidine kinase n=1 Tax=Agromyces zhanjiangensis TaxID=3158562 RepID=UPI00339131DB